jgi:hypothetical protein
VAKCESIEGVMISLEEIEALTEAVADGQSMDPVSNLKSSFLNETKPLTSSIPPPSKPSQIPSKIPVYETPA